MKTIEHQLNINDFCDLGRLGEVGEVWRGGGGGRVHKSLPFSNGIQKKSCTFYDWCLKVGVTKYRTCAKNMTGDISAGIVAAARRDPGR